jgi:hypothetical protein
MRLAPPVSGSSLTVFDPIASKIGADPDRGSGLVGLRDRVEALGTGGPWCHLIGCKRSASVGFPQGADTCRISASR